MRRYIHSKLYLQAISVLREDDGRLRSRPGRRAESSFGEYMTLIYENAYFDYTQMISLAVRFLEGDADEDEDAAGPGPHP